jgi:hypothetical protein
MEKKRSCRDILLHNSLVELVSVIVDMCEFSFKVGEVA